MFQSLKHNRLITMCGVHEIVFTFFHCQMSERNFPKYLDANFCDKNS